ncbi:MAG: selenium metabolism-associated LysR family transcriptional regulator [Acidobacteriota bacterium]|jgi:DNA-binding transcriptional LysR family regulator
MELKYIEIFCAVAELKSFSKAAQALHLTQPTVSIHIRSLEDEFSTRLFDRMGRTVLPTQAGKILYRYAREIVQLKEDARLAMEKLEGTMSGNLIIGASTIPGEYILPSLLAQFIDSYPEIFPALKIGDSSGIYKSVLEGEVDVGIVGALIRDKNIVSKKFLDDELVLVSSSALKSSTMDTGALKEIPLLVRESGSGSRRTLEMHLKKIGLAIEDLNVVAEVGSSQAVIQAVESGIGMAFISRLSVVREIENKVLKTVPLKGMEIKRKFYIITHRLRFKSRICETFIEFLTS